MSLKRPFIITLWTIGAFLCWDVVIFGADFICMYLNNEKAFHIPTVIIPLLNIGGLVGMLIIPTVFALLGMRGKLPGTRKSAQRSQGFEVTVGGRAAT
jgi:hypothetical protein